MMPTLRANSHFASLAVVLFLLCAGALTAFYEEHIYQAQRDANLHQTAEILAASVTAALSFNDREAASEYVNPLKVNPAIEAAGVYDTKGDLLTGYAIRGPLPRHLILGSRQTPSGDVVAVSEHGVSFGHVYLRQSPEPIDARLVRYLVLILLAGMAAVVVGGLASAQARVQRQALRLAESNARLHQEIVERGKAEEALRQSQKMEAIGQLSGGIAHDFNNYLMIIKGNLHLLKKRLKLADDNRHMQAALEGIDRAASLTQRILSFSRRQALDPQPLDLNALISGMGELIRSSLRENVELLEKLDARRNIVVDRNQMENVILNLVLNARDAMPDGGQVEIRTDDIHVDGRSDDMPHGDYVRLMVVDSGVGMTRDVRHKALDPFFTTKPVGQGTGLGLSTTYGFVTQSGGHIAIDSAPGEGTSVSVFLPGAVGDRPNQENGAIWRTS